MNTASLELSKELYELSDWEELGNVPSAWYGYIEDEETVCYGQTKPEGCIPAYDLGFLLRKLPKLLDIDGASFSLCLHTNIAPPDWTAYYMFVQVVDGKLKRFSNRLKVEADTPEDAVCKLAIELFKQGVLKGKE